MKAIDMSDALIPQNSCVLVTGGVLSHTVVSCSIQRLSLLTTSSFGKGCRPHQNHCGEKKTPSAFRFYEADVNDKDALNRIFARY